MSGNDGELCKPIGAPNVFGRREGRSWIEILNFGGDLAVVSGGVEQRDFVDAALAGEEILPEFGGAVAERRDDAQAGDDHSAIRNILSHKNQTGQPPLTGAAAPAKLLSKLLLLRVFDVFDDVAHALQFLSFFVGDFLAEFFFEGHDKFDGVQGVGPQVLDELRLGRHLIRIDAELLDNDVFNFLFD
jgi:hypothetical protein